MSLFILKCILDETGKTECVSVGKASEQLARTIARQKSRERWWSAIYITKAGVAGIVAAFTRGKGIKFNRP